MPERVNALLASNRQLWAANRAGLLQLRERPAEPLTRDLMRELLTEAEKAGLWQPTAQVNR